MIAAAGPDQLMPDKLVNDSWPSANPVGPLSFCFDAFSSAYESAPLWLQNAIERTIIQPWRGWYPDRGGLQIAHRGNVNL